MNFGENGEAVEVTRTIEFASIDDKPAREARAGLRPDLVGEYKEGLQLGVKIAKWPMGTVFWDGALKKYWLADGLHRLTAAAELGGKEGEYTVVAGDYAAAFKFACKANDKHGGRTSDADKRARTRTAWLNHHGEDPRPGDRIIAGIANVSVTLANEVRNELERTAQLNTALSSIGTDNKVRNTKNLGRKPAANADPVPASDEAEPGPGQADAVPDEPPADVATVRDAGDGLATASVEAGVATGARSSVKPEAADVPETSLPCGKAHEQILADCDGLRRLLGELAAGPAGRYFVPRSDEAFAHLAKLRDIVAESQPAKECPDCDGGGSDCTECGGCGWLPHGSTTAAPDAEQLKTRADLQEALAG